MTSARKRAANRSNAQYSTGPRTPAGRARASQNALQHGLAAASQRRNVVSLVDELAEHWTPGLAAGRARPPELLTVLEAEIDLLRARQVRTMLLQRLLDSVREDRPDVAPLLDQLTRADRYECRALSRRKVAVRDFTSTLTMPTSSSAAGIGTSEPDGRAPARDGR